MLKHFFRLAIVAGLAAAAPAYAQTPPAESMAAAKELITTMNLPAQFKAVMPAILDAMKPVIVQGRPEVEKDYDTIMPVITQELVARVDEISTKIAAIYASNFSADELKALNAFYLTPAGQKMLQKMPSLTAQTMALGGDWGKSVAEDLKTRLIDAMRKKGHNI